MFAVSPPRARMNAMTRYAPLCPARTIDPGRVLSITPRAFSVESTSETRLEKMPVSSSFPPKESGAFFGPSARTRTAFTAARRELLGDAELGEGVVDVVAPPVEVEDEVRGVCRAEALRDEDRHGAVAVVDVSGVRLSLVRVPLRTLLVREHRVGRRSHDHRAEMGVALGQGLRGGGAGGERYSEGESDANAFHWPRCYTAT